MAKHRPGNFRILAVDDDKNVLDLYEEFLSAKTSIYNFQLTLCRRSDEAVEEVRLALQKKKPFAVTFLDVRMSSDQDGVWAAAQIRTLDPNIEIVMVTAYNDLSPEKIITRVPPAAKLLYIRKPFSPEEIRQFAVALSAKWQQEVELHKILTELEFHVEERTTDLTKINEQLKREIEERKRAEEALREGEERFREMAETIRETFWLFDWIEQRVIYVSPAYEEIWDRSIEDLYNRYGEWADSIYPEDRSYAEESFARIAQTGGGEPREYRIVRPDGEVRWLSDRGFAIKDKDGEVRRIAGIAEDITERKQAEEALRQSEEKYRTALEANPDPVVVYDIEGRVVYFNPAFTRVFGWSLGERLGRKMDVFVPEENWPETKIMIDRVLAGESFSGIETHRYTKEGKIIPVSLSGAILREMDGNPVGSVINLRDVSEQKNLERQLQQAQKMEAVGTLAGGIAHDFNNLLQAIQGYTELLLMRKKEGERGWRELREVIRAAKRGGELTQQLLTFSRKVESKRRPLDLNREVSELRELLERTIPRMIDVKFKLAGDLKVINADSVQLKQVLMNLAVNAKDAMAEGGQLQIETQNLTLDQDFCRKYAEVKPGDYVLLSISDTGHGMDKETLEHIFDPFYTTKEVGKGTGLGLAIVYGIIKNHEGYIMCYSRPGEGSIFSIYLPVIESEMDFVDVVDSSEPKVLAKGGNETILLVDDEEFIRELGEHLLGGAGYKVLTAADGESALQLYRQERGRIDLVILDLIMPGMGGSKCLEELLQMDPQAQILIASGYSPDASTRGALETGAKGFVSKPYDTSQLLKLVREILDQN